MSSNYKKTEAAVLEMYRVAIQNVETQPQISALMTEIGYDSTKIAEGKALLTETYAAYDHTRTEAGETTQAFDTLSNKKEQLHQTFTVHRRKAKVLFRNDAVSASKLGITTEVPRAYAKWIKQIKQFYATALDEAAIQSKLATLAITAEQLTAANALITEVEFAQADYTREKSESQEATQLKNTAFDKLDDWMSDFYAIARIALEDHPQLFEALGKKA